MGVIPGRFHKHPAHPPPIQRHNCPTIIHVTVTSKWRRPILANPTAHRALVSAWLRATHWLVGNYVIMPDHIHLFCTPGTPDPPGVRRWAGYWKKLTGHAAPMLKSQFHDDCWDTQMRTHEHYSRKLEYVLNNPVRRGLAVQWRQWPHRGELSSLPWILDP